MNQTNLHLKRMEYLAEVIRKYINNPPELSIKDIAIILEEELDIKKLLKELKKYDKRINKI